VRHVGPQATRWAEAALEEHGVCGMRFIQGLLSLTRTYESEEMEAACEIAWKSRAFRYRTVKQLLKHRAQSQQTLEFLEEHPVLRPMSEYGEFFRTAIQGGMQDVR
jgi:hypothetical protein